MRSEAHVAFRDLRIAMLAAIRRREEVLSENPAENDWQRAAAGHQHKRNREEPGPESPVISHAFSESRNRLAFIATLASAYRFDDVHFFRPKIMMKKSVHHYLHGMQCKMA